MKQAVLIIIKPDGIKKKLTGTVYTRFSKAGLKIIASRVVPVTRALAREHYSHIKGMPFFESTVSYFCGKFHKEHNLLAAVFYGENAIKKCRKLAGATNPKEAAPSSIRGAYGRISSTGIFENIVHVSSDKEEAKREIKLWFDPADITLKLYPTKTKIIKSCRKRVWS